MRNVKIWNSAKVPTAAAAPGGVPGNYAPDKLNPYFDAGLHTTMQSTSRGGAIGVTLVGGEGGHRGAYITVDELHKPVTASTGVDYTVTGTATHAGAVEKVSTQTGNLSDDRYKHSEVEVTDADAVRWLKQVPVRKYTKRMAMMQPVPNEGQTIEATNFAGEKVTYTVLSEEQLFEQGADGFAGRPDRLDPWARRLYEQSYGEIGVIAQDLHQTELAHAVEVGDENTEWKVRYDNLTCLNTKVIQTLLARIEALEAKTA